MEHMSGVALTKPRQLTALAVLPYILLLVAYLPTLRDLVSDWATDSNYSHGFVVPIFATYLFWSACRQGPTGPAGRRGVGLAVLALGLLLLVIGTAAAEYFTARLSFVVSLLGLTWYLFGGQLIRRTWFAFFFLCFMIPIPYVLYYAVAFPLQLAATRITVVVLNFIGLGVVQQGNIIHIEGGHSLEVAEACSGMRSLVALLALGAIYAYWTQRRTIAQLLLFVSAVPIAVLANVVRVLVTSLLAVVLTDQITREPLHTMLGLSVFVVEFIGLFLVGLVLKRIFR